MSKSKTQIVILSMLTAALVTACVDGSDTKKASNQDSNPAPLRKDEGVTELLVDPLLTRGIAHGFANTFSGARNSECSTRWNRQFPSFSQAPWLFWEIAEQTYFCDNPSTPAKVGTDLTYSSLDQSKKFILPNDGSFRMLYDTSLEWRKGCNLSMPDGSRSPRYPHPQTTWPHFLIGQIFEKPNQPEKNIWIKNHPKLNFSASVRLNASTKMVNENCPSGTWGTDPSVLNVPNHQLFYIAMILKHKNHPAQVGSKINANQIYALIPMFYSEDGISHVPVAPWMSSDQFGNVVYFAPNYPTLKFGSWVDLSIDVEALTRETIASLNGNYDQSVSPADYQVLGVLIGWEIWGGYRNDVEVKNLSFKSVQTNPSPPPIVQPETGTVLGYIDGFSASSSGHTLHGWACGRKIAPPIQVHLYAGGPHGASGAQHIETAMADKPSEPAVGAACNSSGTHHRFSIPISEHFLREHGGKKIYIHGISPTGQSNELLGNSGNLSLPMPRSTPTPTPTPNPNAGTILGYIDGIDSSGWTRQISGWACGSQIATPIEVHLYVGGPAGTSGAQHVGTAVANKPSEQAVGAACSSSGTYHRFSIPINEQMTRTHGGKKIYIHGISPTGKTNSAIYNSGTFTVPLP